MNHSAEALATRIVWMADTPRHYGKNRWDGGWNGGARVRYWRGAGHRFPAVVSYGGHQELPAGRYRIRLHYRGGTPRKHADRSWGWFRLYPLNRDEPCLGSIDIPRGRVDQPGSLTMLFTNEVRRAIEFRIAGGGADLWLHRVEIEPDRSGGAPECPVDSPGT